MESETTVKSKMNITQLPSLSLEKIFSYLPKNDLTDSVTLVCKEWRDVSRCIQTSLNIRIKLGKKRKKNVITCQELQHVLKTMPRLKLLDIDFSYPTIDHETAVELVNNLKKLTCLKNCTLSYLEMPSDCWASLFDHESQLKTLNSLTVMRSGGLDEATFSNIVKLCHEDFKSLRLFSISDIGNLIECAKEIRKLSCLEELNIDFSQLGNPTGFFSNLFNSGSQMKQLKILRLARDVVHLDETSVSNFVNVCGETLEKLALSLDNEQEMQDEWLSNLKRLPKLKVLSLTGLYYCDENDFSSADWMSLFDETSELKNLSDVGLCSFANFDDNCVKNLGKLCGQNLKTLNISECVKVTQGGIDAVKEMCGPDTCITKR